VREGEPRASGRNGSKERRIERGRSASVATHAVSAQDELAAVEQADRQIKKATREAKSASKAPRKSGSGLSGKKVSLKMQQSAARSSKRRK